jgi:hypothetical protein
MEASNKLLQSERGQSTVEFIITFAFGVSIIFVIFTSAINYATGYLVHYATFMASRVYLTQDTHTGNVASVEGSFANATQSATETFLKYKLSYLGVPDANFRINEIASDNAAKYITVGATTYFEQKIDFMGQFAGNQKLELVSESFLGKEPTRAVCANRVCRAITGSENCVTIFDITLYDDGC